MPTKGSPRGAKHRALAVVAGAGFVLALSACQAPFDLGQPSTRALENGAVGKLSTVLDADTPYIFNVRLFGTEGTVQNNRVFSKKHYPGSLNYWTFPMRSVPPVLGSSRVRRTNVGRR